MARRLTTTWLTGLAIPAVLAIPADAAQAFEVHTSGSYASIPTRISNVSLWDGGKPTDTPSPSRPTHIPDEIRVAKTCRLVPADTDSQGRGADPVWVCTNLAFWQDYYKLETLWLHPKV